MCARPPTCACPTCGCSHPAPGDAGPDAAGAALTSAAPAAPRKPLCCFAGLPDRTPGTTFGAAASMALLCRLAPLRTTPRSVPRALPTRGRFVPALPSRQCTHCGAGDPRIAAGPSGSQAQTFRVSPRPCSRPPFRRRAGAVHRRPAPAQLARAFQPLQQDPVQGHPDTRFLPVAPAPPAAQFAQHFMPLNARAQHERDVRKRRSWSTLDALPRTSLPTPQPDRSHPRPRMQHISLCTILTPKRLFASRVLPPQNCAPSLPRLTEPHSAHVNRVVPCVPGPPCSVIRG